MKRAPIVLGATTSSACTSSSEIENYSKPPADVKKDASIRRCRYAAIIITLAGSLGGCWDGKDTTPIDQSKMEPEDLVADIIYFASRGSNGPYFTWGKKGDTFISSNGENYTEKVKVIARSPCVYELERTLEQKDHRPQNGGYVFDFSKVRKFTNRASNTTVGAPFASLVLEGEPGLVCYKNPDNCKPAKHETSSALKEYADRATNSFRELARRVCPPAAAASITTTEPPPRKWDGTKPPTTADIQEAWNRTKTSVNVTSSSCVSAGGREWRCEVVYKVYINNPNQLMLAGYYENTYSAIYGLQNNEIRMVREYRLINQRRL